MQIVSILSAFLFPAAAQADVSPPAVIAVFELRDPSHVVSQNDRRSLTRYLATKLAETRRFQVVAEDDMRRVLQEKKVESYDACYDEACQIEIGKDLAAQKSVVAEIVQLGDTCAITAVVYDLAKAASDRAATEKGPCAIEALVLSLERLAVKLAQDLPKAAPETKPKAGELRPSHKALSAMRYQFETRDTKRAFKVELLGSDGFHHQCDGSVRAGAFCTIEQVAVGDARLVVTSDGLLDYDLELEIEPKNFVSVLQLDTRPSELAIVTWSFGGIAMATGAALIPIGIAADDRAYIYGGVPSLLVGTGLLILGFVFEDRVSVVKRDLD